MAADTHGKKKDVLTEGVTLYKNADYAASLAFFLSLPDDSGADGIEIAYYIGLCYAKLQRYEDALLYLEPLASAGTRSMAEIFSSVSMGRMLTACCSAAFFWRLFTR